MAATPGSADSRFAAMSLAVNSAQTLDKLVEAVTENARQLVGAHQATTSLVVGGNWARAVHAVSLSDKYQAWREYDERPDGSGIYRLVCQLNRPIRLTQGALEVHPAWRGFGEAASRHPPMRGWLAVPLKKADGRNIGLIQLSDKYEDEFTEEDEATLVRFAELASAAIARVRRSARAERRRGLQDRQTGGSGATPAAWRPPGPNLR